jgi:hypothetical protein
MYNSSFAWCYAAQYSAVASLCLGRSAFATIGYASPCVVMHSKELIDFLDNVRGAWASKQKSCRYGPTKN